MGRDPVWCVAAPGLWAGALAAAAFHPVFSHRLERADVPAGLLPPRAGAAVVHPGGGTGVYLGDDPVCPEPEVRPLHLARVRAGGGGAALGGDLYADLLKTQKKQPEAMG